MDETGLQNPIFKIASTNMQQSGNNQMGMGQMNQNMGNQFDPNMMNQNSFPMNNPMMNQNMSMGQGNMMNQNMNMGQGNMMNNPMMNQNMNMGQGNMMNNQMNDMNGMMMNMMNFNNQNIPMNQFAAMMGNMNTQMANNNFGNQGNFQNNNAQNQNDYGGINVHFRIEGRKDEIVIQCLPDERVSELIKRYRTKTGDNDITKKFIFNAKALNESLTVAEAGLANNVNVFVVRTKGIKGAQ